MGEHLEIDPATGMQKDYVVLTAEERAKGFVRPVRQAYVHVGRRPKYPLRDLTADEQARYSDQGFIKFEIYPEGSAALGQYWTQKELRSGCGTLTKMGIALAETYAREPGFYSGTYCCRCKAHFPVGADGEFVWADTNERVGT